MKTREIKIGQKLLEIPIVKITPDPDQPRKTFRDEVINGLAQSLGNYGLVTALAVRPIGEDKYMIIEGEERWRAAKQAGLGELLCVVEDIIDDDAHLMQLIASVQHDEIPESELATAIAKYLDTHTDISQTELAECLGWNKSDVSVFYRIAKLPVELFNKLKSGELEFKEARELVRIKSQKRQKEVAQPFIDGTATSEHISKVVTEAKEKPDKPVSEIIEEVVLGKQAAEKEVQAEVETAPPIEAEGEVQVAAETETEGEVVKETTEAIKEKAEVKAETKAAVKEKAVVTPEDEIKLAVGNIKKLMQDFFTEAQKLTDKEIPTADWNELEVYLRDIIMRFFWLLNDHNPEAVCELIQKWNESQQSEC